MKLTGRATSAVAETPGGANPPVVSSQYRASRWYSSITQACKHPNVQTLLTCSACLTLLVRASLGCPRKRIVGGALRNQGNVKGVYAT